MGKPTFFRFMQSSTILLADCRVLALYEALNRASEGDKQSH